MPTIAELYQGSIAANSIANNDPNLQPEKCWTTELSAERDLGNGLARTTVFFENTRDALYSLTNVSVVPNVTNIQNIDATCTSCSFVMPNTLLNFAATLTPARSRLTPCLVEVCRMPSACLT
jgi:iron complex outermembrane recepter protein